MKLFAPRQAAALLALATIATSPVSYAQQRVPFDRLPSDQFDVTPPSELVQGQPGKMHVVATACRELPAAETRRRIVDVAVQEWGYFGFPIVDRTVEDRRDDWRRRRSRRGDPVEEARVAASIGGYWAVTSDGAWIVERQNASWNRSSGSLRWRYAWSAAFISWVMCEGGLGERGQFRRAIAHHVYIDQAIRARAGSAPAAAFTAYDPGERPVEPGDLLCSARRPAYRSLAERKRQMGEGARMHCDVVVKVDEPNQHILAIGGNVGGRVSLKILPADVRGKHLAFAHLKLKADPIEVDALDHTPTMKALGCTVGMLSANQLTAMNLLSAPLPKNMC